MSQMDGLDLQQTLALIFRSKERASRFAELLAQEGYDLKLKEFKSPTGGMVIYPEVTENRKFQDNQFSQLWALPYEQRRSERAKILTRAGETASAINRFLYANRPKPPKVSEGFPEQEAFRSPPLHQLHREPVDEIGRRMFDFWEADTFSRPEPFRLDT